MTGLDGVIGGGGMSQMPALSGDLSSSAGDTSITVAGLRGKAIATAAPTNGQVLQFNGPGNDWIPKSLAFSDLSGTVGNSQVASGIDALKIGNGSVDNTRLSYLAGVTSDIQTQLNAKQAQALDLDASGHVVKIQGQTVAETAPTNGQVMAFNGSQWAPADINAGSVTLGGDLSGSASAASVEKIRGVGVSSTTPTAGQALVFSGGQWVPQAVSVASGQIGDFAAAADARIGVQKGVVNGLATLGADGKLSSEQIPATVMNSSYVVSSQAEQLALVSSVGDVAIRTDISKSFVRNAGATGTMSDWNELLAPTSPVQSVNSRTGNVTLTTTDIAEGSNQYFTPARAAAAAVAGDVTGTVGAAAVVKLQGKAVSASTPTTGQVLKWDGAQWGPAEDIGASGADAMSLRGVTVGSATPINGQILQYNGTVWAPASFVPALAGDLSGNTGAAVVARIQGRGVVNTAPGSGQVLKWNGSQWAPADDIGANGSDATSIRGIAVSTTAPTSSQILQYNGSQWAPAVLVTDHSVGADLFGTLSTAKVVKIQGRAVVSTAPTGGQVLTWNGVTFQWEPQTLPATNASKLQGVAISSTAPTSGQFLQYSGTTWAPVSVSMGDATTIQGKVVSATAPQPGQLLQFDGSQYVPTSFAPTANAKELQNVLIATTTPTLNQALVYNGTEWGPKDDVRQISYAIEDTTNDLTATTGSVATVFSNRLTSAMKIVEVYCQTNVAAASTFNLAIGGTNLFSTAQNCTSTGNAYPTGFVVSSIGAGVNVSHNMVTAAAGTKRMSITLLYKF